MVAIRAETYKKLIIRNKPSAARTSMFRFWGAIGDYYYFLTFISPLLRMMQHHRVILAADVYIPRYGGDPLLELCTCNGLIDELWEHSRNHGGPGLMPPEYIKAARGDIPNTDVYTPGIYYDKWLTGPGMVPVPSDELREKAKMEPKYLIPVGTRKDLLESYPQLDGPYVTVQPFSIGKKKRNVLPLDTVYTLHHMGIRMVVLRFPTDAVRARVIFEKMAQLNTVTFIDVAGPMDSMMILAHAKCHLGIESSQILGAGIHDVPCIFYEYGGWQAYARDLALENVWFPVRFDHLCTEIAQQVAGEYYRG